MKVIETIRDTNFGLDLPNPSAYERERVAARAVIFDHNNDIALLRSTVKNYHKLPGGGVEEGEDIRQTLKREMLEEIGCEIENIQEVGIIEESRNKSSLHQVSYCFVANLKGEKGVPQLEADEIEEGLETVWLNLDTAIETIENEKDIEHYDGKFIAKRDLVFLQEVKKLQTNKLLN